MEKFVEALPLVTLPLKTGIALKIADDYVALFNGDGAAYAIGISWPNAGQSLGRGKLDRTMLNPNIHYFKASAICRSFTTSGRKSFQ